MVATSLLYSLMHHWKRLTSLRRRFEKHLNKVALLDLMVG